MSPQSSVRVPDEKLRELLRSARTLAVVGLSDNSERASHFVAHALQLAGYHIIPVNPHHREVLGEKCYPSLADLPSPPDMVVIFRRPEYVKEIVRQAIALGARSIWMQVGIRDPEAARKAREAGLTVVMDRCSWVEYQRLFGRRL